VVGGGGGSGVAVKCGGNEGGRCRVVGCCCHWMRGKWLDWRHWRQWHWHPAAHSFCSSSGGGVVE